jgi:hypothetical protein
MSLIQEALKRQKEEQSGLTPRADDAIPTSSAESASPGLKPRASSSPPPPPAAGVAEPVPALDVAGPLPDLTGAPPERSRRTWGMLAVVLVAVVLLGGGAVWMIAHVVRTLGGAPAEPAAEPAEERVEPAALPPSAPETPTQPEAAVGTPPEATPPAVLPGAPTPPIAQAPAHTPQAAAVPAAVKPAVVWPALNLTGVIGRGQAGSAVINGEVLGIGDTVDGVKVIAIRPQGVDLEYQAERQFLKVGSVLK